MAALTDEVEFRSYQDDAWYSVRLVREGEILRIKYCNFPEVNGDVFEAGKFESFEKLEEFQSRLRPMSAQLQDSYCSKVVEGLHLCASHAFNDYDVRFYDAVVEHVIHKRHSFASGEEECLCSFIIHWKHGPHAGKLMEKKVENICLVRSSMKLDPNVASFLDIARKKIVSATPRMHFQLPVAMFPLLVGTKCEKSPVSRICPSEVGWIGNICDSNRQDTDIGGVGNHLTILLENLEKELSPSTIIEFIHQQTSIISQACVFPSLSFELYNRGAIVLNTEKDLEDLYGFLNNPDHIIISSKGRPWVVAKNFWRHYICRASNVTSMLKSQKKLQDCSTGISNELKLVPSGTEEYMKAKELRDLFMEFSFHQERLHKRLAMEEKKILQLSPAF